MGSRSQALYAAVTNDLSNMCVLNPLTEEAKAQLSRTLLKKFRSASAETRTKAISAFRERHTQIREIVLPSLSYARGFLTQVLSVHLDEEEMAEGMRTGPGSSNSDLKSTCGYLKQVHSRLTCSTEELYSEYVRLLYRTSPTLYAAEWQRRKVYGEVEYRNYSKLVTVPKDATIDRCIATEPIVNTIMQQGVRYALEARLRRVGIDFSTQQGKNRLLAKEGSISGSLATVDFSAASDYLCRDLISGLLPTDWASYVALCCTDAICFPDGEVLQGAIQLSMGNAITFPLQTLIFLALACEVYSRRGIPFVINQNVAVFGDDVIVRSDCFDDYLALSIECGLVPNPAKSFNVGPFRESCGADWYLGHNIRGVYIKQLKTVCDLYVAYNLLNAWFMRWDVTYDISTYQALELIRAWLGPKHQCWVPMHAQLSSGLRCLRAPASAPVDSNGSYYYEPWSVVARPRRAARYLRLFEHGYVSAHLRGYLRNGFIQERPKQLWYARNRVVTPCWGHIDDEDLWLYDNSRTSTGGIVT